MNNLLAIAIIGVGATAVMDLWGWVRKPLFGIPHPDYGMLGRWLAHMTRGQFRHESIAASPSVHGEGIIGWTTHYLTGITFAALLFCLWGESWLEAPAIGPALSVGLGTVLAPFLLMQPGMGAGIAASRTAHPNAARLQSLIAHGAFGLGLYVSGWALRHI